MSQNNMSKITKITFSAKEEKPFFPSEFIQIESSCLKENFDKCLRRICDV